MCEVAGWLVRAYLCVITLGYLYHILYDYITLSLKLKVIWSKSMCQAR